MSLMTVIPHGQHVTGTQQISVAWINEQSFWQLSVPCNLSLFLSNLGNPLVCLMDSLDLISFYLQSVVIPKFLPRCSLKGSSLAGDSAWRLILKLCLHSTLSMTEKMPTVHIQGNRMMEVRENYSPPKWPPPRLYQRTKLINSITGMWSAFLTWPLSSTPARPTSHQSCTPIASLSQWV